MSAREKILEAADELFGEAGFDATSTREIAEKSGVNKALIHYHFNSKEGLLETLLDRYYERLGKRLVEALDISGELRDRIQKMSEVYFDFLVRNRNFSRIVQREASGGQHLERIRSHMAPLFEMGTRVLKETYPATRSGPFAAEQVLVSAYGMIVSYFTYGDMLGHLLNANPMSKENLALRKAHMRRMIDSLLETVVAQSLE